MLQTWRWFGPSDPVHLEHVRQSGASGIVTALHETYDGEEWSATDIATRQAEIENAGLVWSVVESIPVHASIKLGTNDAAQYVAAYGATIRKLAAAGIKTICYNFMPVVDWTRTDLRFALPSGALALRFDAIDFAAYDVFVLERAGADEDYAQSIVEEARQRRRRFSDDDIATLEFNIISGLPGSELSHDRQGVRIRISEFSEIDAGALRSNLIAFLSEIVPVADEVGARMCIHPDDPPFSLFGLPRVVSTADDYRELFSAVPSIANGMTFCTGSLGARADNDLPAMAREFGNRIHFAHLRNVRREPDRSFHESDHLDGDVDMVAVVSAMLDEEKRRQAAGRSDWEIAMRPDHGHLLLDDIHRKTNPGYSAIGRLKGLAELRGLTKALAAHPR